jgi:chromate transporter
MIYVQIFLAFFLPGIIGYGGGPASIPLIENEVVDTYGWMTTAEFSDTLALGNALPGPIATKMAAYIGYNQAGVLGAVVALFAIIGPSLILMLFLLSLLYRNRNSPRVKRLSSFVIPAIAILMTELMFDFFKTSVELINWIPTIIVGVLAYFALEKWKVHPALVIVIGLAVGAVFLQ